MPKSKKPRHAHKRKPGIDFTKVRKEQIEVLKNSFVDLELTAEIKLPLGNATDTDLYLLRDFIQWGIVAVSVRDWIPLENREAASYLLNMSARATVSVQLRGRKNQRHYVCTGEELQQIRDGIQVVGDLMKESLEECPVQMLKEWEVMRKYIDMTNAKGGRICVDEKVLRAAMKTV